MRSAMLIVCLLAAVNIAAEESFLVKTRPLKDIAVFPERSAPATVLSLNDTQLSAEIAARIKRIAVRVGDVIEPDELLVELDCETFQQRVKARRSQLAVLDARTDLAKRRLKRTEKLTLQRSVSEEILDERQSDLAILNAERGELMAELAQARLDVERCRIVSPFRAEVVERIAAEGEFVAIGDPVIEVLDVVRVEISAQAQLGDLSMIESTDRLWFQQGKQRYPVKFRKALGAVNTVTRNRELRLEFVEQRALPGSAGQLTWGDQRSHVPGNLIVRRDGQLGIFVAKDGRAQFVKMPDAAAGRASPVDFPLSTMVVTEGFYGLVDGAILEVADNDANTASRAQ